MKIDVVIPWVGGNDPVLNEKRSRYTDAAIVSHVDEASPTRFANLGEIFWCVASLNRNASFINKIYIVSDGQDPHLEPFLQKYFPGGHIPVEVVDHRTIFRGYEEYLPVFNSVSIETMLWRIPGLSEHYLLMNDDFIIAKPVTEADFYTADGKVICYGDWFSLPWGKLLRFLKPRPGGHQVATFKNMLINAADIVGGTRRFHYLRHTPRPLLRSFYEDYFGKHPELIVRNVSHRFRHINQFSEQELLYLTLEKEGRCQQTPTASCAFYLMPKHEGDYVARKLDAFRKGDFKFCCLNSLDMASDQDRKLIVDWAEELLGVSLSE